MAEHKVRVRRRCERELESVQIVRLPRVDCGAHTTAREGEPCTCERRQCTRRNRGRCAWDAAHSHRPKRSTARGALASSLAWRRAPPRPNRRNPRARVGRSPGQAGASRQSRVGVTCCSARSASCLPLPAVYSSPQRRRWSASRRGALRTGREAQRHTGPRPHPSRAQHCFARAPQVAAGACSQRGLF